MADNINIIDPITEKKLDSYRYELENFRVPEELVVTITLQEYRELVSRCATAKADIDKANEGKFTRDSENEKLKVENAELKAKLLDLREKLESVECKDAE